MTDHVFTVGHLYGGIGGGALGTAASSARFGGHTAGFRTVGSVDVDRLSCDDFESLVGAPALRADVHEMSPADLRRAWGQLAPDVVVLSPPCKGFSALLSAARAGDPKYERMNSLLIRGIFLLTETWEEPPAIIFVENVPRIASRGAEMLRQVRGLLEARGYAVTGDAQHNCGELGGLAQNRQRWFLVARCRRRVPQFVYQPPKQRVRACGEVIGPMPAPGDVEAGGPMHSMPKISWRNWVRLALIPAGGDWRDLPGVVAHGKKRREVHRRAAVGDWDSPAAAVVGPGGAGVENVADQRFGHVDRVTPWATPTGCVTSSPAPSSGGAAVADPRYTNIMQVAVWDEPTRSVIGASRVGSGALSIADPRGLELGQTGAASASFKGRPGLFGVTRWDAPAPTVTGSAKVSGSNAPAAVADPRDWGGGPYGVAAWTSPSDTVTGETRPSNGRFSVADPRMGCEPRAGAYRVLRWDEAAATITGSLNIDNGAAAVADPRIDPDKPPPFSPLIIAADGTWHRPLTTLELAALQGLPLVHAGAPLKLAGTSHTRWREAIGNAIPPPAARAVGDQLLLALLVSKLGAWTMSPNEIWVAPDEADPS